MAEEDKKKEDSKEDKKPEWDKERQRADQAEANLNKVNAKLAESDVTAQQTAGEIKTLKEEIEQINAAKNLNLSKIDPDKADTPELAAEQAKLIQAVEEQAKEIASLKQSAVDIKGSLEKTERGKLQDAKIEKILKPLDEEFGPQFRNEAKRLAEKEITDRGFSPEDSLECHQILRKRYVQLKKEEEDGKKKEPTIGDDGHGSISTPGEGIVEGRLSDVMAQVRKKGGLSFLLGSKKTT